MKQDSKIKLKSVTSIKAPEQYELVTQATLSHKVVVMQDNSFAFDASRSVEFESLFDNLLTEMAYDGLDETVKLELVVDGGDLRPQNWRFMMKGKGPFDKKSIQGYIKFPNDYPKNPPKIQFDFVNQQQLFHANIYGDGKLCIPLLQNWREIQIDLKEMIQAMQHIFENPNNHDPANQQAANVSNEDLFKRQKEQAQYLPNWE